MFAAMYREQQTSLSVTAIATRILSHHLCGLDIDSVAVGEAKERISTLAASYAGTAILPAPRVAAMPSVFGSLDRGDILNPSHPWLDRQYTIVATNPPYLTSGKMPAQLKWYVEQHYTLGKRDLYAAFILRCLELCSSRGRVAMITQQSWMFLRSFIELRQHVLTETTIESLAHLGAGAFEEISGEVVQAAMFVIGNYRPDSEHRMNAIRLVGLRSPREKARVLREVARSLMVRSRWDMVSTDEAYQTEVEDED